jgi:hypothetical protein
VRTRTYFGARSHVVLLGELPSRGMRMTYPAHRDGGGVGDKESSGRP